MWVRIDLGWFARDLCRAVSDSGVSWEDPLLLPSSCLAGMLHFFFHLKAFELCASSAAGFFFFTRSWVFPLHCGSLCIAGTGWGKTCWGKITLWFCSRNQIRSLILIWVISEVDEYHLEQWTEHSVYDVSISELIWKVWFLCPYHLITKAFTV